MPKPSQGLAHGLGVVALVVHNKDLRFSDVVCHDFEEFVKHLPFLEAVAHGDLTARKRGDKAPRLPVA